MLAPVIRGRKGEYVELFRQLQQQGFSRARVDGQTHTLDEPPTLDKKLKHTIEVVVDRLAVKESSKRRLTDSVETALGLAGGLVVFDFVDLDAKDPGREMKFSEKMACPNDHTIDTDDLEPRSFSFNSPFGACTVCSGLGTRMEVDPELVVPDTGATLGEGAIAPWSGAHVADYFLRLVNALGEELGFDLNTPWDQLTPQARTSLLEGHKTKVHVVTRNRYGRQRAYYAAFEGVRPYVERRHREAESDTSRERFEGFMREVPAPRAAAPASSRSRSRSPSAPRTRAARTSPRSARCRSTRPPTTSAPSTCRCASARSASGCSRRSRSACSSCSTSASTTSPSTGPAGRCRAARRSGSGSRRRSAPASSASSTSSTSRRSACTSATTSASSRP